ncbi:MAG: tRNA uridine-5-carboxymethylaminomethyl(34) synthesis enzyme MnmG, partial [Planctomycetota bacterium]
ELCARVPSLAPFRALTDVLVTAEADVKYAGYVERQRLAVERMQRSEGTLIPADLDLAGLTGLRQEAREKLARLRPATLGHAARIAGINPPDVALLAVHIERHRRRG